MESRRDERGRRFVGSAAALVVAAAVMRCGNPGGPPPRPLPAAAPEAANLASRPRAEEAAPGVAAAVQYLRDEIDVFHRECVISGDLESGGERFVPSGWVRGSGATTLPWDAAALTRMSVEAVTDSPHSGWTCTRVRWAPVPGHLFEYAAVNWQNVEDNFGGLPGLDCAGATELAWYARGKKGGETVTFRFAPTRDARIPHQDSHPPLEKTAVLTTDWQKFTFALDPNRLSSVITGFSAGFNAGDNPRGLEFFVDDVTMNHRRLSEPRLVRSYRLGDRRYDANPALRNTAYVYDVSLVASALLSVGKIDRAKLLADAFVLLAEDERGGPGLAPDELRLRNAYAAGDLFGRYRATQFQRVPRLPGRLNRGPVPNPALVPWLTDAYSRGTDAGNMGHACLALPNVYGATGDRNYLKTAASLADWVLGHCSDTPLGFGFTGGMKYNPDRLAEEPVTWVSAEHCIDLTAVMRRLAAADPEHGKKWREAARRASSFVEWAYEQGRADGGRVITGTLPGTSKPNLDPKPLDTQTWSVLALPERAAAFSSGLDWAAKDCRVERDGVSGFGFSSATPRSADPDIWPEGTAQFAVARRSLGEDAKADAILAQLDRMQARYAAERPTDFGAMPGAFRSRVVTGYKDIEYEHFAHTGATAWFIMAHRRYNLFSGEFIPPPAAP